MAVLVSSCCRTVVVVGQAIVAANRWGCHATDMSQRRIKVHVLPSPHPHPDLGNYYPLASVLRIEGGPEGRRRNLQGGRTHYD